MLLLNATSFTVAVCDSLGTRGEAAWLELQASKRLRGWRAARVTDLHGVRNAWPMAHVFIDNQAAGEGLEFLPVVTPSTDWQREWVDTVVSLCCVVVIPSKKSDVCVLKSIMPQL